MPDHADDHDSLFGDDEGPSEIQDALHHAQKHFAEAGSSMSPVDLPVLTEEEERQEWFDSLDWDQSHAFFANRQWGCLI